MTNRRFLRRGRTGLVTVVALFGVLSTATPGGAQAGPEPELDAVGGIEATDSGSADKAPSSMLAESDPDLLGRDDATPVQVVVKLDYDSVATYQGTIEGLEATSPSVTGDPLTGDSAAEQEYGAYIDEQADAFVAELAQQVPEADVGRRIDVVYGGMTVTMPANRVEDVLAIDGVVAVQQNRANRLLTDSSPEFIGAPTIYDALGTTENAGEGVIYGNLDTGLWPEHPSFADLGNLEAPPAPPGGGTRECNYGDNPLTPAVDVFQCQDKLIGGAHFTDDYDAVIGDDPLAGTARDANGHGTHTSSTSAGNIVEDVEVLGIERPSIAGIAPGAWVMEYKVCGTVCFSSDSARAVGQAILDGVDVINFSISGGEQPFNDVVELSFLDAYAAGLFVSASAGNEGPGAGTANHLSPWTTAVAASTQAREFGSTLTLTADNGDTFTDDGITLTGGIDTPLPVVLAQNVPGYTDPLCDTAPPSATIFEGLIVACERSPGRVAKGFNVFQGGGEGMVLYNATLAEGMSDSHFLPVIHLPDGGDFLAFLASHGAVTGSFPTGQPRDGLGDAMTAFSSRGPAGLFIKPDVTAPGLQILAGDTPHPGFPGDVAGGPPGDMFQAIAGTSMSSPHVAGAGLLLRGLHPDWTPGQIRSALMTSALTDVVKEDLTTPADPFDMGAGRIDLSQAGSVPLTFDETADRFFSLGNDPNNAVHLNLPSINAPVMPGRVTTTRTATNVSGRRQRFTVSVDQPASGTIEVSPSRFTLGAGQSVTLNVVIEAPVPGAQQFGQVNIDARRGPSMHLPVAFIPAQAGVRLTQSCSPLTVQQRGTSACTVSASNNSFGESNVDLFTEVRGGLRVAGTDGDALWTSNRTAELTGVTLAGNRPGVPAVDPGALFGFIPLSQFPNNFEDQLGDEDFVNINVPAFTYAGQTWTSVGVTSNGYAVVGGATDEDVNCCSIPNGPDPGRPNNTLAPFWTDLDGTGAPGILANVLTDGVNSWIVIESHLRIFGTQDIEPFQIWIGIDGPQDITYTYPADDQPTDPGFDFLVGAENAVGQGDMEEVLPTGDLRVTSTDFVPGDSVSYVVFVRGQNRGTFPVITSMNATGNPGTTIVQTDLTVVRRNRTVQSSSVARAF